MLAVLCALLLGVPDRGLPRPVDPSGAYVACMDAVPMYRVTITLSAEPGVYDTRWYIISSGRIWFVGSLKQNKDGTWAESYQRANNPQQRNSSWHWHIINTDPLAFESYESWTLTKE